MAAEVPRPVSRSFALSLSRSSSPIPSVFLVGLVQTNDDIEIAISSRRPAAELHPTWVSPGKTRNETVTPGVAMRCRYVNRSIRLASVLFQGIKRGGSACKRIKRLRRRRRRRRRWRLAGWLTGGILDNCVSRAKISPSQRNTRAAFQICPLCFAPLSRHRGETETARTFE